MHDGRRLITLILRFRDYAAGAMSKCILSQEDLPLRAAHLRSFASAHCLLDQTLDSVQARQELVVFDRQEAVE